MKSTIETIYENYGLHTTGMGKAILDCGEFEISEYEVYRIIDATRTAKMFMAIWQEQNWWKDEKQTHGVKL
jgi:hypothetical protein